VVFHPLGREQIRAIVDIQLGRLRQRLAERDIQLRLDDAARDRIGEAGFDTVYGARPLKRAIQRRSRIRWRSRFCGAISSPATGWSPS
jgi:ATP-dependent Clp protease ATP-binding subunit ClpB